MIHPRPVLSGSIAAALLLAVGAPASAQTPRKLGQLRLSVVGVSATLDPLEPVVPKNIASAVRIVVKSGDAELSAGDVATFLGTAGYKVEALLSGPGLPFTISLPQLTVGEPLPADPLMLPLPPLRVGGDYTLSNVRITVGGDTVLDVDPSSVTVKVIDQILVTSVKTRPLTLDEIKEKGIILDADDYLGFEFTLALALNSKPVTFSFPVAFDRKGAAIPLPILDDLKSPVRQLDIPFTGGGGMPGISAALLEVSAPDGSKVPLTTPGGAPIRIPSLLVIPGRVGYLKQFFSAQLFVANGAPLGSNLVVKDVQGTISLPLGRDGIASSDDPLALPEIQRDGEAILQPLTMNVLGVGPDGVAGTSDDVSTFQPAGQGQAEFLLRGEAEGFHTINFDIGATLEGLPVGPVKVTGKASGGVLVRNPYFDMTFTVPSVVRRKEQFKVFVNVTNIGKGAANLVEVALDAAAMSGLDLGTYPSGDVETGVRTIPTIAPGDTKTLEFLFRSQKTGAVVATYLKLDLTQGGAASGKLNFTLGVGERGVPLSPDTLVLPTSVDRLPPPLVEAAMRVLGQAWSIAGAAAGTLPTGVARTNRAAVTLKALAFAEAGLRVQLGQDVKTAIRDLIFDFYGGDPIDPGFDQLLRTTEAGRDFARAIGAELASPVDGAGLLAYERELARLAASGPDFLSMAVQAPAGVDVTLTDALNRRLVGGRAEIGIPEAALPGGVFVPAGGTLATAPLVGLVTAPNTSPYTLSVTGPSELAITYPRGDGTFRRAPVTTEGPAQVIVDLARPDTVAVRRDTNGDGIVDTETLVTPSDSVAPEGPRLLTANVIGPETLQGGNPLGLYAALLFDRVVDVASAAVKSNYAIPSNAVQAAKRQLSGRLVFAALEQPEGPYVPTTVTASGVADTRGVVGPTDTVPLASLLEDEGAVVIGRVVSADGTPVSAGSVFYKNWLAPSCEGTGPGSPMSQVPLTADGRYEIRYVRRDPCGRPFGVTTTDPVSQFERSIIAYVRRAGERMVLDLALLGKGSVRGTVRNLSGEVVPGATVLVLSAVDQGTGGNAITDANGNYLVSGITVGPVTVKAGKDTGIGRGSGRIERAGTTATVDVNIDYGGAVRVSGVVRRTQAGVTEVVPGALVVFFISGQDGGPAGYTWSDPDGKYVLENMPLGPFSVNAAGGSATGNGFKGADLKVDILVDLGGGTGGARFGTVSGIVRLPDGSPAPGVIVARDITGFVVFDGTVTGPDGTFALGGFRAGEPAQIGAITRDRMRTGYSHVAVDPETLEAKNVVITLSGLGTLEFQVLGPTGQPVSGQAVSLLDLSWTVGGCKNPCGCTTAQTGPDGRVRFFNQPVGGMTAQAVRFGDGFVDVAQGSAVIRRDGETGFGVIQFRGTGTVTGKVIPPPGVFATGGEVRIVSNVFENDGIAVCGLVPKESARGPVDLITNTFKFTNVNLGPVYATVTHPLFPSVAASGTLTTAGQVLNFDMPLVDTMAGVLSGVVFLPDGVTPAGAGVEVTANGPVADVMVKTDGNGFYRFAKVFPQGTYSLTAKDPRTGGVAYESIYLRTREDVEHDLRLLGRGKVQVRVVDGSDQPVASAFVGLRETDYPGRSYEGAVEPSNQGVAVLEGVFEGRFSVTVSDPYGRGGRASGVISRPGETVEVTARLTSVGTVRGRFVMPDRLTPIPFGVVRLVAGGRVIGQTTTPGAGDQIGTFSFDFVPTGDVSIDGQDPLTLRTGSASGRLDGDGDEVVLEVVAQGLGTVQGVVRSRRNGGALEIEPGAHVDVESAGYKSCTFADANGRYVLEGIPEGAVRVTATLSGFLRGVATGTLAGDRTVLDLDVTLQDSARVIGRVIKAGTTSTPGAISLVTFTSGTFLLRRSSDEEGNFQFDRVPAGLADITVEVPNTLDRGSARLEVTAGEVEVPIVLNGVGSISAVARDFAGNPVSGTVFIRSQGPVPHYLNRVVGTNGTFFIPEFPAGPFTVALSSGGDFPRSGQGSFTLAPEEAKQIEVRLQPSGTVTGLVLRSDGATPAVGADATIVMPSRGSAIVQALGNGRFTLPNVPFGDMQVQVRDNVTAGVARRGPLTLNQEVLDFGTIVLDDTPVAVTAVDPPDNASGIQPGQVVRLTFSDPLQSAAGVEVRSGTQRLYAAATLSQDGQTLSLRGPWPDSQDLEVVATTDVRDVYGRSPAQAFTSRFRTADLSPPRVLSIVPAYGAIQVEVGAPVVITFSEDLGDATDLATLVAVSGPTGPVAGAAVRTTPSIVTFTPSAPLVGNATYSVLVAGAVDPTGNRQVGSFTSSFKTADTVPPTLTLLDPPNGAWVRSARPQFFLSMSDALSGLEMSTATLAIDGQTVAATRGSNTLSFVPAADLSEGGHTLGASVRDRADNLTTLTSTFRVDSIPPTAPTLTGIAAGQVLSGPLSVTASASDAASGLARIELLSDGVVFLTLLPPSFQATYSTAGLADGPHVLTARAVDVAGNAGPSAGPFAVTVDNQLLTVAISSPAPGAPVRDSVVVRANVSEPVARVEFSVGSVVVTDTTPPYEATLPLASIAEGPAVVRARAVPTSGDASGAQVTVNVDRTAPATPDGTKITAITDGTWAQVQGSATAVEAGSRVEAINNATSATAAVGSGGNGAFALSIQAVAGQSLGVTAVDAAGNRSAVTTVAVTQRPEGTIRGRVLQPDGLTPAAGVAVTLGGVSTQTTAGDGAFSFGGLPLRGYTLEARVGGRLRAQIGGVTVSAGGQVVEQDLTLVGVGTVSGVVRDGANGLVPSAYVTLNSQTPTYGGAFTTATDATGAFSVAEVPVGSFTVAVVRGADRANGGGTVPAHGAVVNVDLRLVTGAVNLPVDLLDGNILNWTVTGTGAVGAPWSMLDATSPRLSLTQGGSTVAFSGSGSVAASEESYREIAVWQTGLFGLDVTRKVYVPNDGYFVRHLDTLSNPSAQPVTVDVGLELGFGSNWPQATRIVTTSSGDGTLDAQDHWAVFDDNVDDPEVFDGAWHFAPMPVVFSGPGGTLPSSLGFDAGARRITSRWVSITVPPGQSVSFLYAYTAQADRARASASAARLSGLPPEVLRGLAVPEAAAVRNFSVPADLVSALPALPANDGSIVGQLFAWDGVTPSAGAPYTTGVFRSQSPFYGRPLGISVDASGAYALTAELSTTAWWKRLVPRDAFEVRFTSNQIGNPTAIRTVASVPATGAVRADVTFSGTAILTGRVLRADGTAIGGGSLVISNGAQSRSYSTDATGAFRLLHVPPATYTLTATHPRSFATTTATVVVGADQTISRDVVFPALGAIAGVLRTAAGAPLANSYVDLEGRGRVTYSNAVGAYAFADTPAGAYRVRAFDSTRTWVMRAQDVTVAADQTATADFAFPPVGSLQVAVRSNGMAVPGVGLRWRSDERGPDWVCCAYTDALGRASFANVVGPQAVVQVGNPYPWVYVRGEGTVEVSEGQAAALTLEVPGAGTVTGTLRSRDGTAQPGHSVYALHPSEPVTFSSAASDGAGRFTLGNVLEGTFRLQGQRYRFYPAVGTVDTRAEVRGTLAGQDTTVALDALLPLGGLGAGGQRDFWEVEAAANQTVHVLAIGTAVGVLPALGDPHLAVYGPDGALAAENDDLSANDKNARVQFTAAAAGRYLIVVHGAGTQSGGYELMSPSHVLRAYAGTTASGVVRRDVDGTPAAGHAVRIQPSGLVVVTGANGQYVAPLPVAGPFTVEAIDDEGVVAASATGSTSAGESATVDLTVPVRERVTVTVRRGPLPFGGTTVTLESSHATALPGDRLRQRTANAEGIVVTTLPVGNVTARVTEGGATYEAAGSLAEGAPLALEVVVPPGLTNVRGVVKATVNPIVLVGITVELSGVGTTTTDATGAYRFDAVPAGTYTLTARAGSVADPRELTLTGGEIVADFALPVGVVAGRVTNGSGASVMGAAVTVTATNGTFTGTTGGDGQYRIAGIAPGAIALSAVDPATGARGARTGTLSSPGQTLGLDVTVTPVGTVTGVVFRAGGTTPAGGVQVRLQHNSYGETEPPATTDADGRYTFTAVRIGGFTVDATDLANGDRGRGSNQITVAGETRTVNVTMTGIGAVVVTVRDGSSQLVPGAQVTVQTQTGLAASKSGTTGGDGTVSFEGVLAGGINVTASANGLGGSTTATVPVGGTVAVNVVLQPAGTIEGRVLQPDGVTVLEGARVRLLYSWGGFFRDTLSASDGAYTFDAVPLGTYILEVVFNNRTRARVTGVVLNTNGQTLTRDLALVGLGTVRGVVRNPDNSVAPNLTVSLQGQSSIGGFFSDVTDAGGAYEITGVPVGNFIASATSGQNRAEVTGTLTSDGQELEFDIRLQNSAVTLPTFLYDANNFQFYVQSGASLRDGTNSVFEGDFSANRGALFLDVVAGGTTTRFAGSGNVVPTEQGRREIVASQSNLAGLNVTRKVFVPQAGYLARYLEVLRNPGSAPVTVDLRVVSNFRSYNGAPRIITTSSGDATLAVADAATADRWVVLDDSNDGDPNLVSTLPAVSFVFDGPAATRRVSTASFTASSAGQLIYGWGGVTVGPGETVALLHFGVQQTSRAAAQASAERLVQLPPEVLDGLSAEEIAAIRNFAVPADGTSVLPALPAFQGPITGRVLSGDGTTPVPSATVRLKSRNVLFGRTYSANTSSSGAFSFTTQWTTWGGSIVVPVDDFVLVGSWGGILTPETPGSFEAGQVAATKDVVFSTMGVLRGTLRKADGTAVSGAQIQAYRPTNPFFNASANTTADGSYVFPVVTPSAASLQVTATWYHPQGSALTATTNAVVTAGQTTIADLALPATGTVTGIVRNAAGSPAGGVYVELFNWPFSRYTYTDGAGRFTFTDVLPGTRTLQAREPASGVYSSVEVTVVANQTTTQDVTLIGLGTVPVQVRLAGGAAAGSSLIYIRDGARDYFRGVGYTNAAGQLTVTNVPVGAFTVRAHYPQNTSVFTDVGGTVSTAGEAVPVTATLPAVAPVRVSVLRGAGIPVPNATVYIRTSFYPYFSWAGSTDSAGTLTIANVPQGTFTVQTYLDGVSLENSGQVVADGQLVDVLLEFPDNPISLPAYRYDANGFSFDLDPDGSITGTYSVFGGSYPDNRRAPRLELIAGAGSSAFTGSNVGSGEEDGREIAINQAGLGGLNVTRKVFVPRQGYFARYLEVLRNPGTSPITVDLRVVSNVTAGWGLPNVIATSSGDATLSVADASNPDRWVVVDDPYDGDPFVVGRPPAVAHVFDGEGASERAGEVAFTQPDSQYGRVTYQWNSVTVPAGGSVAYLHFVVQQTSRAAAQTAAERLRNLPPEALAGLSAAEIAAVRNFAIPADGSSSLPALVSLQGTVTGRVLAGDGTTTIPYTNVRFQSLHPLFGRTRSVSSGATGSFTVQSQFPDNSGVIAVPLDAFVLRANHPSNNVAAPDAVGGFAPGESTSVQDVVFSNTGVVSGVVRRYDGTPVASSYVYISGWGYQYSGSDGRYVLTGLPAGNYTVVASAFSLNISAPVSVTVGQTTVADLTFPPVGTVTGIVRTADGQPAVSQYVLIESTGFSRAVYTSGSGQYTFTDVPAGSHTIRVYQSSIGYTDPVSVTVTAGQTTTVEIQLPAVASVRVTVRQSGGAPLAGAYVSIRRNGLSYFTGAGYADANGVIVIPNVRAGTFAVEARAPSTFAFVGSAQGMITQADHGMTVDVVIAPGLTGNVRGTVRAADGATIVPGVYVTLTDVLSGNQLASRYTDASGTYAFDGAATGAEGFRVAVFWNGLQASASGAFTTQGETVTLDLTLPLSVVRGTVVFSDGATPVPGPSVFAIVTDPDGNPSWYGGTARADGRYTIVGVPVGAFRLTAQDPASGLSRTIDGNVTQVDLPVDLDVMLPASGTVVGRVLDESGAVMPELDIALIHPAMDFDRESNADDGGNYRFDRVALGGFVLQACEFDADGQILRCGTAQGSLATDGQTVTIDVQLPARATLSGTVRAADGTTPVANATVTIESLAGQSLFGTFERSVTTDENGSYSLANVPVGAVRVTAMPPEGGLSAGVATGALTTAGLTLDVTVGNATRFTYDLDGTDGYRYDLSCDGRITGGGRTDGSITRSYEQGARLDVNGNGMSCTAAGVLEESGREVAFGPVLSRVIRVERKVFVPAAGGFARYLEVLTNTSSQAVSVPIAVSSYYYEYGGGYYFDPPEVVVAPGTTGNTYAIVSQPEGGPAQAVIGTVFAGPGAPATVSEVYFANGEYEHAYRWSATVPANATVIVMHFVLQGTPGNVDAVRTRAQALVNLTDPDALAGMTAAERSQVVNFNVPAQ